MTLRRKLVLLSTFIAAFTLTTPDPASAGIVLSVESGSFAPDTVAQLYSLDVFIDLTGADDGGSIDVGNFQVRAQLSGPGAGTDVAIVGLGNAMSLAHPQARPLDVTDIVNPTQGLGYTFNFLNPFPLDDLDGLMSITLEVQPNVTGEFSLELLTGDGNTLLTDPNDFMTLLPLTTSDGGLNIGIVAVPEPSSTLILGIACAAFTLRRRPRRLHA